MTRVLLTSFEPFGGQERNASLEVGRAVAEQPLAGVELDWLVLPVVAGPCIETAWAHIEAHSPDVVLSLGQSDSADALQVERLGVNVNDFPIPDNTGQKFSDVPICPEGPAAYFTTIPARAIVLALNERGIPAKLSYSAGTYVCNYLLYSLLHRAALSRPALRAGFIHVPLLLGQNGNASTKAIGIEQMVEGIRLSVVTS